VTNNTTPQAGLPGTGMTRERRQDRARRIPEKHPKAFQKGSGPRRDKALSQGLLMVRWSEKPKSQSSRWTFSTN
jgi:hypothetical protein